MPNDKLILARLKRHWSVAVASQRAGVSVNTFNRWERGLQVPQLATLDQLCRAFDMSADELGFGFVVSPDRGGRLTEQRSQAVVTAGNVETIPPADSFVISPPLMPAVQRLYGTELQGLHGSVDSATRSPEFMKQARKQWEVDEKLSRRQAIAALIGTPAAVFGLKQPGDSPLLHTEEIVTICATHIPLCWQLYFEGGLAEVRQVLPEYVAQLSFLAQQPGYYQQKASLLASKACQLASLIMLQRQDYGSAHLYANQGYMYGELAGDPNLQTAALVRLALVYFYLKRAQLRLQAYERALQFSKQASPLLQGRVFVGLSETYSSLGREQEALRNLDLAQAAYPDSEEDDPNFAYTHFKVSSVSTFKGLMYLNLRQPRQAWEEFSWRSRTVPAGLAPDRVELTVNQTRTSFALGDIEQTCAYIEKSASMALALGSQLRFDETYEVFEQAQQKWRYETRIKALEELFH